MGKDQTNGTGQGVCVIDVLERANTINASVQGCPCEDSGVAQIMRRIIEKSGQIPGNSVPNASRLHPRLCKRRQLQG